MNAAQYKNWTYIRALPMLEALASGDRHSVSVIIPTKDRPEDLALAVRSLLDQSLKPEELLIADQSGNLRSRDLVQTELTRASQSNAHLPRVIYLMDPSLSGAAEARNCLMDRATGDIWVFLDDDVYLERDYLEQIIRTYRAQPAVAGVSGIITNYRKPPIRARSWSWIFARGPFRNEWQPIYWNAERLRETTPIRVAKFAGACMSFRADVARALRFDSRVTGGSLAEDIDFCARIAPARLVIAPTARLIHNRASVNRTTDHWLREHAQSSWYMYRRNWRKRWSGRASFLWLNGGYLLVLPAACLQHRSIEPWRAFRAGVRRAKALTT